MLQSTISNDTWLYILLHNLKISIHLKVRLKVPNTFWGHCTGDKRFPLTLKLLKVKRPSDNGRWPFRMAALRYACAQLIAWRMKEEVWNMTSLSLTLPLAWRTVDQSWRYGTPFPAKRSDSHSGSNYYFCIWSVLWRQQKGKGFRRKKKGARKNQVDIPNKNQ